MTSEIIYTAEAGIGLLTINRPEARNALNWRAQERFAAAVDRAAHDAGLRVLIVTGAGDKAFVSGGDLKELIHHPEAEAGARLNRVMGDALAQMTQLPLPVIAAVNGHAVGGGCEIMTACDLRLASERAHFSFAQAKVGLTTGWGGTARLVRLLGQSRALELLLTGRVFDGQEARRLGFVHRLTPAGDDVVVAAMTWAQELIKLPRQALAATKKLVYAAGRLSLPEAYQVETQLFTELWSQPDHLAAMEHFVNRQRRAG